MPPKGERARKKAERLEVIRGLIFDQGWPTWKVYKAIQDQYGVSPRTIRRDIQDLGKMVREASDDPDAQELAIRGCIERLAAISVKAQSEGKWKEAISANQALLRALGVRSDRWAGLAPKGSPDVSLEVAQTPDGTTGVRLTIGKKAAELAELSDEELEQRRAAALERFQIIEGGRGEAPEEATAGLQK